MSQPTAYSPAHEFLTDEIANPNFPGSEIDIELNALELTLDEILANLALIQRDDGALKNAIVTVDSLSDVVKMLIGDADVIDDLQDQFNAVDANVAATAADVVLTHADVVTTHADVVTAAASASTATTQAGIATTQAGTATTQAGIATTQANAAAASAAAAAVSADAFDDVYLGSKAANPTLDNDGNALVEGQLYWNSVSNALKVYDGAAWQNYNPLSGLANIVEDTSPQLGGNLDVNGFGITGYLTVGAGNSAYQPLDADLTAIAALTTTAAGRTALTLADPGADRVMIWDESAGSGGAYVAATLNDGLQINGTVIRQLEKLEIALSDETTAITTGTNKATYSFPYSVTFVGLPYATLNTVSSSGTPTVDINEAGTTLLSTKLTIDASEKTSGTAAVAAVVSDAVVAANAEIGFDIDVAGTGAKGLKVSWDYYRT